jgi:hypothetical protein
MGGLSAVDKIQLLMKGYSAEQIEEFAKKVKKHNKSDIDKNILSGLV